MADFSSAKTINFNVAWKERNSADLLEVFSGSFHQHSQPLLSSFMHPNSVSEYDVSRPFVLGQDNNDIHGLFVLRKAQRRRKWWWWWWRKNLDGTCATWKLIINPAQEENAGDCNPPRKYSRGSRSVGVWEGWEGPRVSTSLTHVGWCWVHSAAPCNYPGSNGRRRVTLCVKSSPMHVVSKLFTNTTKYQQNRGQGPNWMRVEEEAEEEENIGCRKRETQEVGHGGWIDGDGERVYMAE